MNNAKMPYGLLGEKLGHSFSPEIHALLSNPLYELKPLSREEFGIFMTAKDFKGVNVTIPYKEEANKYCTPMGDALQIGSINTVVNRNGNLFGYNTDISGMEYMIKRAGCTLTDKKVAILGSGGTAKCAHFAALKAKASSVVVLSRSGKCSFTEENDESFSAGYEETFKYKDADVIINTTPVGMYPSNYASPVLLDVFTNLKAVFDCIFNPLKTNLLSQAEKKNITYSNGLPMLVAQAWYANAIFFDLDANRESKTEEIEKIIETIEKKVRNIVFIGMPGSGKSSLGRAVAENLSREFADSDDVFTTKFNMSPGDYINEFGEEAFREKETEVICEIMKETGKVFATGGGSILREVNRDAIKMNSICVFTDRDLDKLSTDGRPLSKSPEALKALYENRIHIYKSMADITISVKEGDISGNLNEIKRLAGLE